MIVLGLMSGTSLDGLDMAMVEFKKQPSEQFKLLQAKTIPLPETVKQQLDNPFQLSAVEMVKLDWSFAEFSAKSAVSFIQESGIEPVCIASHGQTIFHQPPYYTTQIGNGAVIAAISNYPVVSDFRSANVAFKGQGAPLVPIGDQDLFNDYDCCINIGGFSNISFSSNNTLKAHDICAANIVLNALANELGHPFDDKGGFARKGNVNSVLLTELNGLQHYSQQIKPSLGTEWVNENIWPILNKSADSIINKLATYTEHMAIQVANSISGNTCLISGGGVFNTFLLERIKAHSSKKVLVMSDEISNFKEAIVFAYLGYLRWVEKENILQSYTGASKNHCAGSIHLP